MAALRTPAVRASRAGRTGRWAVFGLTVVIAAALTPYTVADSGSAAVYLLGVPVVAAAIPVLADLNVEGITITPDQLQALFALDPEAWSVEAGLTEEYFGQFDAGVPAQMWSELDRLRDRIETARRG